MNDQERNEYVGKLLTSEDITLEGLEGEVLSMAKKAYAEIQEGQKKLEELQREVVRLSDVVKNQNGQLEGFVKVLLEEEGKRRLNAN